MRGLAVGPAESTSLASQLFPLSWNLEWHIPGFVSLVFSFSGDWSTCLQKSLYTMSVPVHRDGFVAGFFLIKVRWEPTKETQWWQIEHSPVLQWILDILLDKLQSRANLNKSPQLGKFSSRGTTKQQRCCNGSPPYSYTIHIAMSNCKTLQMEVVLVSPVPFFMLR